MNCKMNRAAFAVLASLIVLAQAAFAADEPEMTEFPLATEGHRPQAITAGPDGNLGATEVIHHHILLHTPAGAVTAFHCPGPGVRGFERGSSPVAPGALRPPVARLGLVGGMYRGTPALAVWDAGRARTLVP